MNTRREFLRALGGGLLLVSGGHALAAPPPTPVDVVQAFLTARATHEYAKAYALFSTVVQKQVPYAQFAEAKPWEDALAHAPADGVSPTLAAVSTFFMDSHDSSGYQFTVIGPDSADPRVVLVRARPPNAALKDSATIKIVTAPDPNVRDLPRIEMMESYQKTNGDDFDKMREQARAVTSLSNLKQIALAIEMYAQDHHEQMPDADQWVDQILPYLGDRKASAAERERGIALLFRDPSTPQGEKWSYAFNRNLSGVKLADIKNPAETVLLFESTAGVKNAADAGQSVPHGGRHNAGDYYAFADGHAKWFRNGTALNWGP